MPKEEASGGIKGMRIAITGNAGSGKSTLAKVFQYKFGGKVLSFATPLKQFCVQIRGREIDKGLDRPLLQKLGQYYRRDCNADEVLLQLDLDGNSPGEFYAFRSLDYVYGKERNKNFWVDRLIEEVRKSPDDNVFNDDTRFLSEEAELKKHGFTIVKLVASQKTCIKRLEALYGPVDPNMFKDKSETEIRLIDADITVNAEQPVDNIFRIVVSQLFV